MFLLGGKKGRREEEVSGRRGDWRRGLEEVGGTHSRILGDRMDQERHDPQEWHDPQEADYALDCLDCLDCLGCLDCFGY